MMFVEKIKPIQLFYYLFVIIYFSLFLISPSLGPIDDWTLLPYLKNIGDKPLFIDPYIARFYPLNGQEYGLTEIFSKPSPFLFYLINAFQFFILSFLLVEILKFVTKNKYVIYLLPIIIFLSPAFGQAFFRLQVAERGAFFFFTIFVWAYLRFSIKENTNFNFWIAVISSNIGLYYKEPGFIAIGSFAFIHLLLSWKKSNKKEKALDFILITSALMYLLAYYVVVFSNRAGLYYGGEHYDKNLLFIKHLFNYIVVDYFISLLLPIVFGIRIFRIFKKKEISNPIFDSMLGASYLYLITLISLNIYQEYYLLPIYCMAIPALVYFIPGYFNSFSLSTKKWSIGLSVLLLANFLITGLSFISYNKNVPINYIKTINLLASHIKRNENGTNIYLEGVHRDISEIRVSMRHFLNYLDVNTKNVIIQELPSYKEKIKSGSYLILSPFSFNQINDSYIKKIKSQYDNIYSSESFLDIPNLSFKNLIKLFVSKIYRKNNRLVGIMNNENLLRPTDYHIFIKK